MTTPREYRIFISSPSDVWAERERLFRVITRLAGELAPVKLTAFRWEETYYSARTTFQDQIPPPSQSNVVVCIFWKRLGSELPLQYQRPDGTRPTGSEYEFEEAVLAAKRDGTPDVLVYRKTAPVLFPVDQLEQETGQFTALQSFWQRWFQAETGHFTAGYHSFGTTDEFEAQIEAHLRQWLERQNAFASEGHTWSISKSGSPFRGLEPFDESHAAVFFGRRRLVEHLRERLIEAAARGAPFLLLLGMSGAGKSSLARAGLVPRLTQPGAVPGADLWRRCVIRPSEGEEDAILALARALYRTDVLPELAAGDSTSPADLAALLRGSPEAGAKAISRALQRCGQPISEREAFDRSFDVKLLLLIDQFEELFGLASGSISAFVAVLRALVGSGSVWVVCTMRSDFYPRLQAVPELVALKQAGETIDVLPPGPTEIEDIVTGPARAAGLSYGRRPDTNMGLDEELVQAASALGSLPFLQFTLQGLFSERDEATGTLTVEAYDRLGGLGGAIDRRAEAAFSHLDEDAQAALPHVMRQLVTYSQSDTPTGRTVARERFASSPAQARLVEALILARLLVAEASGERAFIRLAHDSLIIHWTRASNLLSADRDFLRMRARVEASAKHWEREGRDPEFLLQGGRPLAEAAEILLERRDTVDDDVAAFIEASLSAEAERKDAARRREEEHLRSKEQAALRLARRTRAAAIVVSLFFVLALAAAAYALQQRSLAEAQAQEAERNFAAALASATSVVEGIQAKLANGDVSARVAREILGTTEGTLGALTRTRNAPEVAHQQIRLLLTSSNALLSLGDSRQALQRAQEAARLAQQLVSAQPNDTASRAALAASRYASGDALLVQGGRAQALVNWRAAVDEMDTLATADPEHRGWQLQLLFGRRKIADALRDSGLVAEALAEYRQALSLTERLMAKDARNAAWVREFAVLHERIGTVLRKQGDLEASKAHYETLLALAERMAAADPENMVLRRSVAIAHEKFGFLHRAKGDTASSLREYRTFQSMMQQVTAKDPSNSRWRRDLSDSHDDVGDMLGAQGDWQGALRQYRAALAIRKELVAKDPDNLRWQSDLSVSYEKLGQVHLAHGEVDEGLREFRAALEVKEALVARDPANAEWRRELAAVRISLGKALVQRGDTANAVTEYRDAMTILEPIAASEPGNLVLAKDLQSVRDALASLQDASRTGGPSIQ